MLLNDGISDASVRISRVSSYIDRHVFSVLFDVVFFFLQFYEMLSIFVAAMSCGLLLPHGRIDRFNDGFSCCS